MEKSIDVSWVEAIENGLLHVDKVVRNPSRTIVDVEEIVPIALSRKTTVESIKHLAQHTDLIQSIDEKKGTITPSKILNIHKEESLATYENRFVNTLIDRLYIFIMTRYEKLSEVEKDEEVYAMEAENQINDNRGNLLNVKISIDTKRSLDAANDSGYTIWQRVEKLKKTIEGYKGSELCTTLGNNFIQPPVMRTNAIMKNVDLKACLTLWQYILSYDKTGYEINVEDVALKPESRYVKDLNQMMACNLILFQSYTVDSKRDYEPIGSKTFKAVQPKVVKRYRAELLSGSYDIHTDGVGGFIEADSPVRFSNNDLPENTGDIFDQIEKVITIERNYYNELEQKRLEELALKEEAERRRQEREARLEEKRRIEEARREERERAKREREEEERRIQEMLERRKAEIEAEEKERARLEAERKARIEEERRLAEQEAKERAERERLEREKASIRAEFGEAEGIDPTVFDKKREQSEIDNAYSSVTSSDIEEAENMLQEQMAAAAEANAEADKLAAAGVGADGSEMAGAGAEGTDATGEEDTTVLKKPEFEDPREVAVRMKLEQQKKEKEQREKDRAQRLKAERQMYEAKPFHEIYKLYTYNPIYSIPRFFRWLLYVIFGVIPKDTDNPDQKRILAERAEAARKAEYEKSEREKFIVYYKKYATNFPYNVLRFIDDQKFKRKRKKANKDNPKPKFTPPNRTPEETKAIELQMKTLYKTYHVSVIEKIKRKWTEISSRNIEINV